jgi:hypothetical protein
MIGRLCLLRNEYRIIPFSSSALPLSDLQALLLPQPVNPLHIDSQTLLLAEQGVNTPVTKAVKPVSQPVNLLQ